MACCYWFLLFFLETGVFDPSKGSPSPTWDMVPHLGGHPNAYTFTKQLAEALLLEENLKFPIVVVRPSIGEN